MVECVGRCVSWRQSWVNCLWRHCWLLASSCTCLPLRKINDKKSCGAGWQRSTLTRLIYAGNARCGYWRWRLIDWVKILCPSCHRIGHFRDVLSSQSLGLVLKKKSTGKSTIASNTGIKWSKLTQKNTQKANPHTKIVTKIVIGSICGSSVQYVCVIVILIWKLFDFTCFTVTQRVLVCKMYRFLSTESEQLIWKSEGLPSDELSMENAMVILQVSSAVYYQTVRLSF